MSASAAQELLESFFLAPRSEEELIDGALPILEEVLRKVEGASLVCHDKSQLGEPA